MSLVNFKNTVDEFNSRYKKEEKKEVVKSLSEQNEKHINNTYNSLNYKYMKLQKKYKSYKAQDNSTLISEGDLDDLLNTFSK
tara:strand:+ start:613 stop:858 length:246 start_codon:yes stop_codon:yes gene_type:complete